MSRPSLLPEEAALLAQAREAAQRAYCPYSNFPVGAAVRSELGVTTGCNVENASYGLALCAERVALFTAVAQGARSIRQLAVSCIKAETDEDAEAGANGPEGARMPCGACRQVMAELMPSDALVLIDGVDHARYGPAAESVPIGTDAISRSERLKNSMPIASVIPYLLVILLVVSIFAVIRLWSVLGSARVALANLETTRQEAMQTVKRLDETVATADKLLREEVGPTLQAARATLTHVEATTRTLAEATASLRRITGRAEAITDAKRLITAGAALAAGTAQRKPGQSAKRSGSLLSLIGASIVGLLSRSKKAGDNSPKTNAEAVQPQIRPVAPTKRER